MSDACHLQLVIHGHVRRVIHMSRIVDEIVKEGFNNYSETFTRSDRGWVLRQFIELDEKYPNPVFEKDECNYGNIDDIEDVLQRSRVAYQVSWDQGSSYPGGNKSWHPQWGLNEHGEDGIEIGHLRVAAKAKRPARELRRLIREYDRARGDGMPSFSMAPSVERWLAVEVAAKALAPQEDE